MIKNLTVVQMSKSLTVVERNRRIEESLMSISNICPWESLKINEQKRFIFPRYDYLKLIVRRHLLAPGNLHARITLVL